MKIILSERGQKEPLLLLKEPKTQRRHCMKSSFAEATADSAQARAERAKE